MKIYHTLGGCANMVHGREFPMNSVVLVLDNKVEIVCCNFNRPRKEPLELFLYIFAEKRWIKTCTKNTYTEMMWTYYRKKCKNKHKIYCKKSKKELKKSKNVKPVKIPNSIIWATKHPYQGGAVSPR